MLGGIKIDRITLTFLDGSHLSFTDVEYLKQPDGCVVVLAPNELLFSPLSSIKYLQWKVQEKQD